MTSLLVELKMDVAPLLPLSEELYDVVSQYKDIEFSF